jgi:spore coat polysaccharide biosynthesis protein SpsF (cytidylyltransferase family)
MLERLSELKDNIIIATTDDGSKTPIVELCKALHVSYFEGDTDDVLGRYYQSALNFGAEDETIIVRCTSDCPLIDADIIKHTIEFYKISDAEYVCACQDSGFPRGMDTEVFSFKELKEAFLNAQTSYEKEHVTPYIKANYKTAMYKNTQDHSKYRLTLDEKDDYTVIEELYKKLGCKTNFSYTELIQTLEKNPYIYEINKHVEQKKYTH